MRYVGIESSPRSVVEELGPVANPARARVGARDARGIDDVDGIDRDAAGRRAVPVPGHDLAAASTAGTSA